MTEAEWLACTNPQVMLSYLGKNYSPRKFRLFACACCRHPDVWVRLGRGYRNRVLAAELALEGAGDNLDRDDWENLQVVGWNQSDETMPKALQADLLRDIAGNPFRPYYVRWSGGPIGSLSRAAYEERLPDGTIDPARLAILADAVEEAGCTEALLLDHLRSPGPHVRGCWALDVILGKE